MIKRLLRIIPILVILSLILISCVNQKKDIDINNPAFVFGDDINKTIDVSIKGKYNVKENNFKGSMVIGNDINFENVIFSPGSGLISYNKTSRTYLGQIFFDYESKNYTIEITDPSIYSKLTNIDNDGLKTITISSPAKNLDEAKQINKELKEKKLPFEK